MKADDPTVHGLAGAVLDTGTIITALGEAGDDIDDALTEAWLALETGGPAATGGTLMIVRHLLDRLAAATGQPRDDLWRETIATVFGCLTRKGDDRER